MKHLFKVCSVGGILAMLGGSTGCTEAYGPAELIGTWEGASEEMSSVVARFARDGTFRLEYTDKQGGTHSLSGTYETDFIKAPIPLSFRNIPQLPHPLHTIIQFNGPDSLLMGSFAPRWRLRPIAFDPKTQIILKRQRQDEAS